MAKPRRACKVPPWTRIRPRLFQPALIILAAAAVVIPLFHRLRLSPVLGFMLVGVAVGPFGLATLADRCLRCASSRSPAGEHHADRQLGISMLMFMIGLELSLERLRVMRRLVFGLGLAQFVICAVASARSRMPRGVDRGRRSRRRCPVDVVHRRGAPGPVGGKTAERPARPRRAGDTAVPGHRRGAGAVRHQHRQRGYRRRRLRLDGGPGGGGRARPDRRRTAGAAPAVPSVARTGSPELFVAACLLVVLATGLATAAVRLPMELGSLIAGLLLAETEFRRQVEVTIEPFKGLLVGVFLISVGMSLDLRDVAAEAPRLLAGVRCWW